MEIRISGSGDDLTCEERWVERSIDSWTPSDTMKWLVSQLLRLGVKEPGALRLEHFANTCGRDLVRLSLAEFTSRLPSHGDQLYHQLQVKIQAESQFTDNSCSPGTAGEIDLSVHRKEDLSPPVDNKRECLSLQSLFLCQST